MLLTTALVAALLGVSPALAAPHLQKRFDNAYILSYRTNLCLTLPPGIPPSNGAELITGACSSASTWEISPGSGSVILKGTNYALDAGTDPHNNVPAKIWQSYPGLTQQTWYLTNDMRIAITGGNQCLDEGDNGPQTYQCTTGNTNQIWYVNQNQTPPPTTTHSSTTSTTHSSTTTTHSSTTSTTKSSTTTSSTTSSSTPTSPVYTKNQLKFSYEEPNCATVQGAVANGTPVNLQACAAAGSATAALQTWNFAGNSVIQLTGTNFCLDAGTNPHDGVQMKIWQCYPGLLQQTWNYPDGNPGIFQTGNGQCLDLDNSGTTRLQTWACSSGDRQQQFIFDAI